MSATKTRAWAPILLGGALWVALCIRWFDTTAAWRPHFLSAVPPLPLAMPLVLLLGYSLARHARSLLGPLSGPRNGLLLVLTVAAFFRLPVAWSGAAGAVTPDGALSGIIALHVRDGVDHQVFVPHVPYSGSLKSHLAAPLAVVIDPARAFALASLAFYLLFVASVYRLALHMAGHNPGGGFVALASGLYLALSPPYVTRYSLSNDGNYVEVLALGTAALFLAVRWIEAPEMRPRLAFAAGILLGLGFWCHILAVVPLAAFGLALLWAAPRDALLSGVLGAVGWGLGDLPGLLWNYANEWSSFRYIIPGLDEVGSGPGTAAPGEKALRMVTDQLPFLLGYDPGYPPFADVLLQLVALAAVGLALWALARAAWRIWRVPAGAVQVLLIFVFADVLVAFFALPQLPGNPRYLLLLMAPLPILLADACDTRVGRPLLAVLIAAGALASVAQWPGALLTDAKWRGFVAALRENGVRFCYTDFYLATKINFLSAEQIVCSAKLGPTTTEYFFEYRDRVEAAPEAALVAVNQTAAQRLERRLTELGVGFERRDLMKPTLLRLSRKVDPEELFPGRDFSPR